MMKTIGLVREPSFETRICLLPKEVNRIISSFSIDIVFEPNIGHHINIPDEDYLKAGAVTMDRNKIFTTADFMPSINSVYEGQSIEGGCEFLGIFNFLTFPSRLEVYLRPKISVSTLDLLPRTTLAQKMDVLSSMASLNGYKAVIKAIDLISKSVPMFTTAAGTLRPLKVLVLGAGVAGLQAIATAKRLGAIVEAFDVRRSAGEAVRSLGAKFIEVEGSEESDSAGGYAIQQTSDFQKKQKALIHHHLKDAAIVICTANIPGKKAPLLIDREGVENMPQGSIIIDLASEQGGNCELTCDGKILKYNTISIIGNSHLSREIAWSASTLLSSNYFNFIHHMCSSEKNEDHLLQSCSVIENGIVMNENLSAMMSKA